MDLPWNPTKLEQRIGRIKRYGQKSNHVKIANLVYQGTLDKKVYEVLSERMKGKFAVMGSVTHIIEDQWIEEHNIYLKALKEYIRPPSSADVFELRYGDFIADDQDRWELCEKYLDKSEFEKILRSKW